jgi:glycosyltransferase involved in cell wall biosynthesis
MRNSVTPPASKKIFLNNYLPAFNNGNPKEKNRSVPQILFLTSYPPRECGIATYSEDLIKALNDKFEDSFRIKICALENDTEQHQYPKEVKYILNTQYETAFKSLANIINLDNKIELVVLQHEFGFYADCKDCFTNLLAEIKKKKIIVFHTVLPNADDAFKAHVNQIIGLTDSIIVMTDRSAEILRTEYNVPADKITVIAHGTHLVPLADKYELKEKYRIGNRKVLSTFGLLGPGKSIETTLDAMAEIVKTKPDVLFLIIGKTHPGVAKHNGEAYREMLENKVREFRLENNVQFINKYLGLDELLEYLQLTDIYLFTSKDPNQAVSGTFSYAASCGCAIVSTPIPHAKEFLSGESGLIIDFGNSQQLAQAVNKLLFDVELRNKIRLNALHKIVPTSWENSAIAHATLFEKLGNRIRLQHKNPEISLNHIKKMTTHFGMYQFAKLNKPDRESGHTLDDNSRALIAMCQHYALTKDEDDLKLISIYLDFIQFCQQGDGTFLNYVDDKKVFTEDNVNCNLEDSNGRAIWALGYVVSLSRVMPAAISLQAETILQKALVTVEQIYSTRAMAFIIKGLYHYNQYNDSKAVRLLIKKLADRLTQMYLHEATPDWQWFESYLTYANSVLPEALLMAYLDTKEEIYCEVARKTFDFLLSETFNDAGEIKVISNRNWYVRGGEKNHFGEQPIDVAYTIFALRHFYNVFKDESYRLKMETAFEWFLGRNHLNQIIYNPCTGGCFDGLEETNVNLNQGAESTVSYLMARLSMEKYYRRQMLRETKIFRLKLENYAFKA